MPKVSASDTRVYYINGNSEVWSLPLDGKSSVATHVLGRAAVEAGFAVSPDDRRIAVAAIDYAALPPALRLYVENLAGGGNPSRFSCHRARANSTSDLQLLDLGSDAATPIGHDLEVVARFVGSGA